MQRDPRVHRLVVLLTSDERAKLECAARVRGLPLAELVREHLRDVFEPGTPLSLAPHVSRQA